MGVDHGGCGIGETDWAAKGERNREVNDQEGGVYVAFFILLFLPVFCGKFLSAGFPSVYVRRWIYFLQ